MVWFLNWIQLVQRPHLKRVRDLLPHRLPRARVEEAHRLGRGAVDVRQDVGGQRHRLVVEQLGAQPLRRGVAAQVEFDRKT
jgi:hypothetical protein